MRAAPERATAPAATADSVAATADLSAAVGSGPTGTNVQEAGVDEPDTVKAAGGLLLVATPGSLQVLRGGAEPDLLATLPLGSAGTGPAELLVDGDRVLALLSGWRSGAGPASTPLRGPDSADTAVSMPVLEAPFVTAVLVDLAEPTSPRVLESLELDGHHVAARLVGGAVRLVTSSAPLLSPVTPAEPYGAAQEAVALAVNEQAARQVTVEQVLPRQVRRDAEGTELAAGRAVDCADVARPATDAPGASTLLVTTLRPADGLTPVDRTAVTTDGELVYASPDRLYVATSRWGTVAPTGRWSVPAGAPRTELHAFDTGDPADTRYLGTGSVDGYVYGRWALSAHQGHLRVATTLQPPWDGAGQPQSSSTMTVLAESADGLVETGRVEGLGPDEQIYAVRYFGELATVVTFRQTDPLYVLDLADPADPRLLGELKVPGFSTYLHPVGAGRLLGVGQDADGSGRVTGFQLSLFDLSDLSAPVQLDRLSLGAGWSPAGDDARAFSYDPARSLAARPFQAERGGSAALGVRVEGDRLVEAGRLDVGPDHLQRVLLVEGSAHAVSVTGVVTADADSWTRTGAVQLPG